MHNIFHYRCLYHHWQRGGNASNNCTVAKQLGAPCEYFGTMSNDLGGRFLQNDLDSHAICRDNCVFYDDCDSPISTVIINVNNGSRTILHSNRNLPEPTFEQFAKLDLTKYKWVHFEGRNVTEVKKMIEYIKKWNLDHVSQRIPVSVELEKPKQCLEELLMYGDFLFIGKDFARMHGYDSMEETVKQLGDDIKSGVAIICAWGEMGASIRNVDGSISVFPANKPEKVIDTLGAGDTFVAATISMLSSEQKPEEAVRFGCRVAGFKCGRHGFEELSSLLEK
ncbi:ketohexokinase-like isoform X1 [Centruroides sculpturatus]|uniref:ketohexokinase-like isoform X1 n=2 Tax=Centruroides sculpturatus TaxID=218467 RepID=UPI000C6EA71B|nr:ketohexokinase-like isoform X1 [Centruroides sculpturatus]XP_023223754.1 ketohexokinase-like isoform X1 [Centruroides sculpturatus]